MEVGDLEVVKSELFAKRLELAKHNKSEPFDMTELEKVLKSLKAGKIKIQTTISVSYSKRVLLVKI